ncbi:MAG: isocitrate/isopropylmalate dehydrogenase family protein [Acidimicrobiales bacterium]|nr:isocitrate/isopropylmalate dehydrogenase family protein [Acidimicrobiales bacterium]
MSNASRDRRTVCVIPGDDAAPEGVNASLRVLLSLGLPIDWDVLPIGAELAELDVAERERFVHDRIDAADTCLFGSTNGTTPGATYMRWGRRTYANVRPVRWRPGFRSPLAQPDGIDYVIVRENLEDAYIGVMGDAEALRASGLIGPKARLVWEGEGRFAVKVITRPGTEAVARFSYELARKRRGKLTVSAKTNMLPKTDRYFCDIVREIGAEYPDVAFEQYIVADMAHRLVLRPHGLDVLLLPNLYGDVLSDEAAATLGGMGLAPSGCYGDDYAYFESAHGTAPDIVGQGILNPTGTLLSAVMMLEYLGFTDAARRVDDAVSAVYAAGEHIPPDQGGTASTDAFADAVLAALG